MKTILYRGGVLKFRIPASWREEYSDVDGGMFYQDGSDAGTLRVSVITLNAPPESGRVALYKLLRTLLDHLGKSPEDAQFIGENALVRYDEPSVENGTRLRIFYWVFANPVVPENARIVTFSYSVVDSQARAPEVLRELEMLDREIVRTEFAAEIGVVG